MKINNLTLENFRIHENLFVEFESGLNLLLGENGTGKSSILEAIGITLFGSSFRDGNIKGQKQCIKIGKKNALIKIEFVGNDGETYIIENQLKSSGSGFYKLYNIEAPEDIFSGNDEVKDKLKVLVGIPGDLREVYDNIIVAKQNEFINNYKQKEGDRQKLFDRIFETDIYRVIYEGYSKDLALKYKTESEWENKKMELKNASLEDIEDLKKNISITKENIEASETYMIEKKHQMTMLREKIEKQTQDENELNNLKKRIEIQNKNIIDLNKRLQTNSSKIDIAIKAGEIVKEYTPDFEEYTKISEQLKKEEFKFSQLDKKNTEYNNIEKENTFLKNRILLCNSEEENLTKQLQSENGILLKLSQDAKDISKEIEAEESKKIELENKLSGILPLITDYEILKNSRDIQLDIFKASNHSIETLKATSITHENMISEANISELEKKIESIKEIRLKLENNKNLFNQKNALLNNNQEALATLSNSICPYLEDSCKNLEGKDINSYFINKANSLKEEIILLKVSIEKDKLAIEDYDILNLKLSKAKDNEKELENIKNKLINETLKLETISKELENINLKVENFILKNGSKEELISKRSKIETEINSLDISHKSQKLNILTKDIRTIENKIEEHNNNIQKNLFLKNEINSKSNYLEEQLISLKDIPLTYENCKNELIKIRENLNTYKKGYSEVLSNRSIANELDSLLIAKEDMLINLKNEDITLEEITLSLKKLQDKLNSQEPISQLRDSYHNFSDILGKLNMENGELKNQLATLNTRIEKNSNEQKEILEIKKTIKILDKKIELTKIFRDNIKDMGTKVSENILKEISFLATDNFRKITGRAEQIIWSNLESAYQVTLKGGEHSVPFEQLSGGEQVAVAISIRGAMARKFTNTKFSIFDEPTNNLDLERRKSLSDNIGEILQELDQSIIVTHDDTFKEMAQKVIELKK